MAATRPARKSNRAARTRAAPRALARNRIAGAVRVMAGAPGTARLNAARAVLVTAEKDPARVYPHLEEIAGLLRSDSRVIRWNAILILGLLADVDVQRRLDRYIDEYLAWISAGNLVSAANAIRGAGLMAQARPDMRARIVRALLRTERAEYETPECRNVAIGQVLDALRGIGGACERDDVRALIRRQASNTRPAVARRAKQLIAELEIE